MIDLDEPLYALDLFDLTIDLLQVDSFDALSKKTELPKLREFFDRELFCRVFMGWHAKGLYILLQSKKDLEGGQITFGVDTRAIKTASILHRYCHLFCIEFVQKKPLAKETTTFRRSEDSHELCDPYLIECSYEKKRSHYLLHCFIPMQAMVGYDPERFSRIGFFYTIKTRRADVQDFALSSSIWNVETSPALWNELVLRQVFPVE